MSAPVDVLAEIKEAAAGRVSTSRLMATHDAVAALMDACSGGVHTTGAHGPLIYFSGRFAEALMDARHRVGGVA